MGYGNADGSAIERLDFTSSGDWVSGGDTAPGFYHDADADFDIDLADVASFAACFDPAGGQASPACLAAHDYDDAGVSDGVIDLDDFTALTGPATRYQHRSRTEEAKWASFLACEL